MCQMALYLFKVEVFLLNDINDIFIHRLVPVDKCFDKFKKTLSERYKISTKSKCIMTWIDAEDDLIRIFNESDFMLFVELKGTKIYVIDESIWDDWNDRRIPQNARNINESLEAITDVSETSSNWDVLLDIVNNEEELTAEAAILLNVEGNEEKPAEKSLNEIEKMNEDAELTEQLIENPKICSSRKAYDFGSTISSRSCIKERQSVPSNFVINLTSSPKQHLNEVSVISDNDRPARADRLLQRLEDKKKALLAKAATIEIKKANAKTNFKDLDSASNLVSLTATEEPKEKQLHKEETTDIRRRQSVPSNFEIGLTSSSNHLNEVSHMRPLRELTEKRKAVLAKVAAIDSVSKLDASSTAAGFKGPRATDVRTEFKVPEAISELAVSAKNNLDQMESIFTKLSNTLTEVSTSSQYKRKMWKRCVECGLFRSLSRSQNSVSFSRLPHLKGETCSACGRYKRKERKADDSIRILVKKIKIEPGITKTMQQVVSQAIPQAESHAMPQAASHAMPQAASHAMPQAASHAMPQRFRVHKYLGAKIKIEQEIPETIPQVIPQTTKALPKTMPQANLQAMPQLNTTAVNHDKQSEVLGGMFQLSPETWKRCVSCQLYKSKAGHFHSGFSLILPHSEGKVCKICGGPEIQRRIFYVADPTYEEIFNNAFVDAANGLVNNQQKCTGAIPKTSSKLKYKINEAVNSIMGMGYKNVDGRLTRLVESVNGDVIEALALLKLLDKM